jgi:hypothetical protein
MPQYRYELRQGETIVATGHLEPQDALEVGDRLEIGGHAGIVRTVEPLLGNKNSGSSSSCSSTATDTNRAIRRDYVKLVVRSAELRVAGEGGGSFLTAIGSTP